MFHVLRSAPIVVLPSFTASSLRSSFCAGAACPHEASGVRAPRHRRAVAARAQLLSAGPRATSWQGHRRLRTNRDYICIFYTTSRTSDRRASRDLPRRRLLLGNFSTALAGDRGAASASTASRSRAPRGGSSAPPVWSRPSSACPRRAPTWRRRSPRTVAASRGVSWLGRALVACEGGIETTARARGVGRSSRRVNNGCRLGRARPKPAVIITSMGLFASGERGRAPKALRCSGAPLNELVKASFMF